MKVRWDPQQQRFPALAGKLVVDTYRGQIRVRAWPKKRGTPKSAAVRRQNRWFTDANDLAKFVEPTQQNLAIAMTLGTGLYPRDLLLRQMAGGMYEVITDEGRIIPAQRRYRETVVYQGARVALDAPQSLAAGIFTTLTWPLPVRDSNGFWNAGEPTRLTIPEGISVIDITASWDSSAGITNARTLLRINMNGLIIAISSRFMDGTHGGTAQQNSLPVVEGDFFEAAIFTDVAASAEGPIRTSMSLAVRESI